MEIYPLESNTHKQYAIKSKLALETLKKLKNELQNENSAQLKYLFKVIEIELP